MEDIKSLDDFIKGNFQKDKLENYKGSYKMGFLYYKDLQLAIENLINRNKELEKLELEHKKINGNLRDKIKELEYKYERALSDLVIAENTKHTCPYIPTSGVTCKAKEFEAKIKEKIEEINSRIEKYREYTEQGIETDIEWVDNVADRETVQVLQELLEE